MVLGTLAVMDTNDLTEMTRKLIWIAEDVSLELRSELGASASSYQVEEEFLNGSMDCLNEILEDPQDYLDFWNILDKTDVNAFILGVRTMSDHISKTLNTLIHQRGPTGQ